MSDITNVLQNWSRQPESERGRVIAKLYEELRRNAANHLRRESGAVEWQPTSLVNEAYLRLVKVNKMDMTSRSHFFGLAGRIMREILVDEARRASAKKRDHGLRTRLTDDIVGEEMPLIDILTVNDLLNELEKIDPVYVQLFEARAFAGMTIEEAAESLGMSASSVKRKWKVAMAWLVDRSHSLRSE